MFGSEALRLALLCSVIAAATHAAPAADAQSRQVVQAANALLAVLSDAQRQAVMHEYTDAAQRARWSNFPGDFFMRAGVRYGEMNTAQRAALLQLLGAVLSPAGLEMVQQQMAADDIVRDTPPTAGSRALPAGRPGGPTAHFGSDYYYVALLGQPSTTEPWMLQFGGHHLALNATVVGPNITLSPSLTGGEPLKFIKDGKPVYIVAAEATRALALLNALSAEQRGKAVISTQRINLVLGPGHDGQQLQPEGLPGRDMSAAQRAQLLGVVEARIGLLNVDDCAAAMVAARSHLDDTWFAWYGPVAEVGEAYFRVTGPTVLIEFAPQANDARFPAASQHAHNMYRDLGNEYGTAWTTLK